MNKLNLLLLDDEIDLLEILGYELEDGGVSELANIFTATNGIEGLELLKSEQIDCILSDINMPEMNGIQFVKKAQESGFTKPVIFLSAHGDPKMIKKTNDLIIFDFLQKPFDANHLCSTIKKALSQSSTL